MEGNSIKDEIIASFKQGTTLTKLIYINLGVFVLVNLLLVGFKLFNSDTNWVNYLACPAQLERFLRQPWSLITYMFLHENFIHIFFNILTLYWMGRFFLEYATQHTLVGLYILGGIAGGVTFMLGINLFPLFSQHNFLYTLIGASASTMAITVATAIFAPERPIRLALIGEVRLKWIAIALVLISLLGMGGANAGGQMAHIGGALAGYLFAKQHQKGVDITHWISQIIHKTVNLFNRIGSKPKMKGTSYQRRESDHDYNYRKKQENEEINRILDKIKSSGYDSLNDDEKKRLFGNNQ